jgi:hypothetical protein
MSGLRLQNVVKRVCLPGHGVGRALGCALITGLCDEQR